MTKINEERGRKIFAPALFQKHKQFVAKTEEGKEVKEISFVDLNRGDRLLVETLLGSTIETFDIIITGKRKDGLWVSVKKTLGSETEEFTAVFPGVLTKVTGDLTPCVKIATQDEVNCLFFKNLKDIRTHERICSTMTTTPIRKVTLFKTTKQ